MIKDFPIRLFILILTFALFNAFSLFSQKKNKAETTGWNYNDESDGGFEYIAIEEVKLQKSAKKYFKGMKLIRAGTFSFGKTSSIIPANNDSTLIINMRPIRVSVSPYYLSDHEVTNAEYREFVNWVIDSVRIAFLAKTDPSFYRNASNGELNWEKRNEISTSENTEKLKPLYYSKNERYIPRIQFNEKNAIYTEIVKDDTFSIEIYPDTLCWINEFPYSYIEPMSKFYFSHPAYDNYPVVGVSYIQAKAYCQWRSKMINLEICKTNKIDYNKAINEGNSILLPEFRLPTEAEWEYAARAEFFKEKSGVKNSSNELFPWSGNNLYDSKGNYYANFGPIKDVNGFEVKSFQQYFSTSKKMNKPIAGDVYFFTSLVKSFSPNGLGLYDMAGNAAEWVLDNYIPQSYEDINNFSPFRGNIFSNDSVPNAFLNDSTGIFAVYRSDLKRLDRNPDNINYLDGDYVPETNPEIPPEIIKSTDDVHVAMKKLIDRNSYYGLNEKADTISNKERWLSLASLEIHNVKVAERFPDGRIVKGGSWVNGPVYMQCGSKELFPESKGSSRIGFRICMSIKVREESHDKK